MEQQKDYNDLFLEFSALGSELDELSLFLLEKIEKDGRISHSPKIQWSGVVGAIQESKEEKKRIAFLNDQLYKGMSYAKLAFFIINKTDEIVEKALLLQESTKKSDLEYYSIGELAFNYTTNAAGVWHNYAPEAAETPITIGDQENVSLWLSVKSEIEEQLLRLNLSDDLREQLLPKNESEGKSAGCLGIIATAIITLSPLLYFVLS